VPHQSASKVSLVSTIADGKPLCVGLLSNRQSGRNRQHFGKLRKVLADYPEVIHCETATPAELVKALQHLAQRDVQVLIINGGDGTVQLTLTALLQQPCFPVPPMLAILPSGTTNMTAGDVGLQGSPQRALGKLLAWSRHPQNPVSLIHRHVLRVQTADASLFGMFFGAGAIIRGIELCHQRLYTLGLRNEWAPGLATLRILAAIARRDPAYIAPVPVGVSLDQQALAPSQDYLVVLVSTLDRLFLGLRPYWGRESGALFYTAITANPKRALGALPPLLWGRPNRFGTPQNGYHSHNVNDVQLKLDSRFTLDGELYSSQNGSVRISPGEQLSFIRV
jgi:hypothetical protein